MKTAKRSPKPATKYLVRVERDESGMWVATVPDVPGCHTQGRTIEQARDRIREALQAWFDLPKEYDGELVDDVQLPPGARRLVRSAGEARRRAHAADAEASEKTREALNALVELGWSLRDAGAVIGVTRQRAQQLAKARAR